MRWSAVSNGWLALAVSFTSMACGKTSGTDPGLDESSDSHDSDLDCAGEVHTQRAGMPQPGVLLDDGAVSGSRLEARFWLTDDGLRLPSGLFQDLERLELCKFARAADGEWRCLPTSSWDAPCQFEDPDMTRPVFQLPSSGPLPDYFAVPAPGCSSYQLITSAFRFLDRFVSSYAPGDEFTGATFGSDCRHCDFASDEGPFYAARLIDPNRFARAKEAVTEERSAGLALHQLLADDGAALNVAWHAVDFDMSCRDVKINDTSYCVPDSIATPLPLATDVVPPECPKLAFRVNACERPSYGLDLDPEGELVFYEVIAPEAAGLSEAAADCVESLQGGYDFGFALGDQIWVAGNEVEFDQLPRLASTERAGDRLRQSVPATVDGELTLPTASLGFHDTELGIDCVVNYDTHATLRCLPEPEPWGWFADAKCSQPLVTSSDDPAEGDTSDWVTVVREMASSFMGFTTFRVVSVHERGDVYEGQVYSQRKECEPIDTPTTVYDTGSEIPSDRFVSVRFGAD